MNLNLQRQNQSVLNGFWSLKFTFVSALNRQENQGLTNLKDEGSVYKDKQYEGERGYDYWKLKIAFESL